MRALAAYAKIVDSSALASAPRPHRHALCRPAGDSSPEPARAKTTINRERIEEGLKFMRHLHARAAEGAELMENPRLFQGIDRYERAVRKVGEDHQNYLADAARSPKFRITLPLPDGSGSADGRRLERRPTPLLPAQGMGPAGR